MRFSKEKMLKRLKEEGRLKEVTNEAYKIMDNIDGMEATENCWRRRVYNEPLLLVRGRDGILEYVNERDCI